MTLQIFFHRAARAEFVEAAVWYGARRPDLGSEFVAEIERCLALAAEQPLLYGKVHNSIRRVVAKRFPYSVYYIPESGRIVVLAVFHVRRNPLIWKDRT